MKKLASNTVLCVQPLPQTIVSCRDKDGKNNALVVGFVANVSLDPVMVMVGITPTRYSHHIVKESGCFVINFPKKSYKKEYGYLGSASGRDEDKISKVGFHVVKTDEGQPAFEEGKMVFVCKKLMETQLNPEEFIDPEVDGRWYPQKDYHTMYVAKIKSIYNGRIKHWR